ncbi:HIT domain-containing protein [Legionella maioricensis]|uniref:HIT domain-containing protein n=1 Tax=Legionella maioricensis TaxID=2896528 RepID=A0A9X2I9Z1_9GAMM|nr:HIT domain-containing protein [Legionella maioricensis]MCL9683300.1 HIT domain-containing protein [Legionella maioricensis]MCL9686004.1 HIT domain-containing protein [Legionella maioricensis]
MFSIDERIQSTGFSLGDWPLSRVFLKNEACYPWFILVPRRANIQELYQLDREERQTLIEEINHLSLLVNGYFKPDKLNVGALGNVVPQLHVHVVARSRNDDLWPQGLWQSSMQATPYDEKKLKGLLPILQDLIQLKGQEIS